MKKIKQGNGIESDEHKCLGWMNREGSTEEEEFKLKSRAEKELSLIEQGRCTPRRELKFKRPEAEQVWFVKGTSREPAWLESRERKAR